MNTILRIIDKLNEKRPLDKDEFAALIDANSVNVRADLAALAEEKRKLHFENKIYIRGLIEFSNHCKRNCFYCGLRCGNKSLERYRLSMEEILACCEKGYSLGFRTFVLQSGEDGHYGDKELEKLISTIHKTYPDCAITLSLGERSKDSYRRLKDAGADRYLLRHETASSAHYSKLHPPTMSFDDRMKALKDLKQLGYQVGCGFMVGSPFQKTEHLARDLMYIQEFKPHMVGIGPFISHKDTPFHDHMNGTMQQTLLLISILRLMQPKLLIPSTTALNSIAPDGRAQGIKAGANVIMPNLSPEHVREQYSLYDNRICNGDEAAENLENLKLQMQQIGYEIVVDRGDSPKHIK